MKIGLVQTKHNKLYDFLNPRFEPDPAQCPLLQAQQVVQNLELLEQAKGRGFDLLVTTECINYIRTSPAGEMLACGSANAAGLVECVLDLSQTGLYRAPRLDGRRPELYQ